MRSVKCVLVGDENVDKQELLSKFVVVETPKVSEKSPVTPAQEEVDPDQIAALPNQRFRVIHNESDDEGETSSQGDREANDLESWCGIVTVDGKRQPLLRMPSYPNLL